MTPSNAAKLRARATEYDRDADFHARDVARYAKDAAVFRKNGDFERARVAEINQHAAERCEEKALLRALGARLAAARLEHAEARTKALMGVAA